MPASSYRLGSNNTDYDYLTYGHVPNKPLKVRLVSEQPDQLKSAQIKRKNKAKKR